jgi:hypothetical protein
MTKNENQKSAPINRTYFLVVVVLTFIFPFIGFIAEHFGKYTEFTFQLFGKWFILSAVGLRLLLAGIRQSVNPAFTARQIFDITSSECYPIIRELGFANLCFGLVGVISLFKPEWRIVSAFASGLYFGIAGIQHIIKKPVGPNEQLALWTDLVIFAVLMGYLCIAYNL